MFFLAAAVVYHHFHKPLAVGLRSKADGRRFQRDTEEAVLVVIGCIETIDPIPERNDDICPEHVGFRIKVEQFLSLSTLFPFTVLPIVGGDRERIRIGIGAKPNPQYDLAAWVLGKLPAADRKAMTDRYPDIEEACKLLMDDNLQYAQNKFNH